MAELKSMLEVLGLERSGKQVRYIGIELVPVIFLTLLNGGAAARAGRSPLQLPEKARQRRCKEQGWSQRRSKEKEFRQYVQIA